jgi:hypothetical protein
VKTLSKVAEERGVKIIYGCQITDIDETRPAVHFEDGSSIEADLIVGADSKISSRPEVSQFITLICVSRNPLYHTRCHPERQVSQKDQAFDLVQHRSALRSNQSRS